MGRFALALAGLCGVFAPLSLAAQGLAPAPADLTRDQVLALETALTALNFDPGEIDGEIDERFRAAIRLYQDFAALPPDGVVTPTLQAEILSVAASFVEMRSTRVDETAAPAPAAPALAVPEAAPPEGAPPELAAAESGAPETTRLAPDTSMPVQPEPAQPEPAQPEPVISESAEIEATHSEPPLPELSLEKALADPQIQAIPPAPSEIPAAPLQPPAPRPVEPEAGEPPLAAPTPPLDRAAREASPKAGDPAAQASAAAPAPEAAVPQVDPAPAPAPEAKQRQPGTASGFDIGGVLSRLAEPGKSLDRPAAAAPDTKTSGAAKSVARTGQVARLPAPAADGYAAFREAYEAAQNGDFQGAVERYSAAIDSKKLTLEHLGDAHFNRGNASYFLGRHDDSIADYDAAIGSKPTFAGAFYNRGFAHQAKGARQAAIEDFRRARDLGLQRLGVRAPDRPPPLP